MATIPPPEIFVTDAARVFCDGDERVGDESRVAGGAESKIAGGEGSRIAGGERFKIAGGEGFKIAGGDGHPRVWLQIGEDGFADCGYCDRRFILAGGRADRR